MTHALTKISLTFAMIFAAMTIATSAFAATTPLSSLKSGDLIRGHSFSAVYYYGEDGMRYVFPNDKIYFTWYSNFSTVKWLTDAELTKIQIGGNVTYKPGTKMIKINSDPTVYAVSQNGTLRAIDSEMVAIDLYGKLWNKMIDDLPDGFFGNYTIGSRIELPSQFSIASEKKIASINDDKSLHAATVIHITDSGYDQPTIHLSVDHAVRWINDGTREHTASEWDGVWGSGTLKPGESFTRYFGEPKGTWTYYSKYDPPKNNMTGTILVE